ncbi:MAG: HAD family hydrolase [Clostridiales bacterium]|nr:HAD family hydrolase [Clostridiales bacterium]
MKAYLFDLDGTLLNSLEDIADSMNFALEKHGLAIHPLEKYRYFVGDGAKVLAQRATGDQGEIAKEVQKTYQAYYEKHNQCKTRPYDGIVEMLEKMKAKEIPMAIFSNKPHKDTVKMAEALFPKEIFQVIRGQIEGTPVKPDPTGALLVAKELSLPAKDIFYLGDTGTDMRCAVNAGMFPIGVTWGFRSQKELEENGAKRIIHHPLALFA